MKRPEELEPLAAALEALAKWLEEESVPGVIVGGVAASLLGRPRMTRDIDAVVLADDVGWEQFVESGAQYGFSPRIDEAIEFAHRTRVLLLHHEKTEIPVDISLGALSFEAEIIQRRQLMNVGALRLPIITPEDLLIMKALARRPRDIGDIESVLDANPELDLSRVRLWLREFSAVLEMPEIQEEFERIIERRRRM